MVKRLLKLRSQSGWLTRAYVLLCGLFLLTLGLEGIRIWIWGGNFPMWYGFGFFVLICPWMVYFLDQDSLFVEKQTISHNALLKWSVGSLLLFGVAYMGVDILSLGIWCFIIFGLLFGLSGRFSFWMALWMLGLTVFSLVIDQQTYAELFSIYLYYFLCIGVVFELVDGKIAQRLGSDFLSHFGIQKFKKAETLNQSLGYYFGVGVFVLLLVVSVILLFQGQKIDNLIVQNVTALAMTALMLMVLWGREYLADLAKLSRWIAIISSLAIIVLMRICFYYPMIVVGKLPIIIALSSVVMQIVAYLLGEKRGLFIAYFISGGVQNER